jgi:hypothetical protein
MANLRKWSAILMVTACFLWAVSCAQKGAAAVTGLGNSPTLSGAIEVEETAAADATPVTDPSSAEEALPAPPHGSRVLRLGEGEGKPIEDFTFAPALKIRVGEEEYDAVRPSCTWTKDGQTLIACGMEPFEYGETMDPVPLLTPLNGQPDDPELVFERNPDRMTVTVRYKARSSADTAWESVEYGEAEVREFYEPENGYLYPMICDCVFVIEAEWDVVDGFGGTGVYVFRTAAEG